MAIHIYLTATHQKTAFVYRFTTSDDVCAGIHRVIPLISNWFVRRGEYNDEPYCDPVFEGNKCYSRLRSGQQRITYCEDEVGIPIFILPKIYITKLRLIIRARNAVRDEVCGFFSWKMPAFRNIYSLTLT